MLIARPLKALADYSETRQLFWTTCEPLRSSLRIEPDQLAEWKESDFEAIEHHYTTLLSGASWPESGGSLCHEATVNHG